MNEETTRQLEKDAAFYHSFCLVRRLFDESLITKDEYKEILRMSKKAFGTDLI